MTPLISIFVTDNSALATWNTNSIRASVACCVAMVASIAQLKHDIARTRDCIADSLRLISDINDQLNSTRRA